jgi:hypothetical protein
MISFDKVVDMVGKVSVIVKDVAEAIKKGLKEIHDEDSKDQETKS